MEIEGIVKEIHDEKKLNDTVTVRRLVVTTDPDGKYPKDIPVDFYNDKCRILSKHKISEKVNVGINLGSKNNNGILYPKIYGWKVASVIPSEVTSHDQNPGRENHDIDLAF